MNEKCHKIIKVNRNEASTRITLIGITRTFFSWEKSTAPALK